jgi:hypothetical protein
MVQNIVSILLFGLESALFHVIPTTLICQHLSVIDGNAEGLGFNLD